MFSHLCNDVTAHILSFLPVEDLRCSIPAVCQKFNKVVQLHMLLMDPVTRFPTHCNFVSHLLNEYPGTADSMCVGPSMPRAELTATVWYVKVGNFTENVNGSSENVAVTQTAIICFEVPEEHAEINLSDDFAEGILMWSQDTPMHQLVSTNLSGLNGLQCFDGPVTESTKPLAPVSLSPSTRFPGDAHISEFDIFVSPPESNVEQIVGKRWENCTGLSYCSISENAEMSLCHTFCRINNFSAFFAVVLGMGATNDNFMCRGRKSALFTRMLNRVVWEGVAFTQDRVPDAVAKRLTVGVDKLALRSAADPDYHPGSEKIVRDLLHPSLYCYVKDASELLDGAIHPGLPLHGMYGRQFSDKGLQWLPTWFKVDESGRCSADGYINGLDEEHDVGLKDALGELLTLALPQLEAVVPYALYLEANDGTVDPVRNFQRSRKYLRKRADRKLWYLQAGQSQMWHYQGKQDELKTNSRKWDMFKRLNGLFDNEEWGEYPAGLRERWRPHDLALESEWDAYSQTDPDHDENESHMWDVEEIEKEQPPAPHPSDGVEFGGQFNDDDAYDRFVDADIMSMGSKVEDNESNVDPGGQMSDAMSVSESESESECSDDDEAALPFSFRGTSLQVVCKVVDYELEPGAQYEGVWHVEGLADEAIVATVVYVLERGEDLRGANIAFVRAFDSSNTIEEDSDYGNRESAETDLLHHLEHVAQEPLGKVGTPEGRLVVFPNTHIHKVHALVNRGTTKQRRRVVVFWLVNPLEEIVSTREVPDQHKSGKMSREQAEKYRLELMEERRKAKQGFNGMNVNMCEH